MMAASRQEPFWRTKTLEEMSDEEWESLCDGCGHCCRVKLENSKTDEVLTTHFTCMLLDVDTCRCTDYPNRKARVPGCLRLTPEKIPELPWLPDTCAYVKISRGEDLDDWHPLVSGDPDSVHAASISVRGKVCSEVEMDEMQEALSDLFGAEWVDEDEDSR